MEQIIFRGRQALTIRHEQKPLHGLAMQWFLLFCGHNHIPEGALSYTRLFGMEYLTLDQLNNLNDRDNGEGQRHSNQILNE